MNTLVPLWWCPTAIILLFTLSFIIACADHEIGKLHVFFLFIKTIQFFYEKKSFFHAKQVFQVFQPFFHFNYISTFKL